MTAFKYTKTDGAEYFSHLDLLRHIYRTLRRAGIPVNASEGYHPHPRIFLNNPLPVGVKSVAEYGFIDTPFTGDFKNLFNAFSPAGIKCLNYLTGGENPNYANGIERCAYRAAGLKMFDPQDILSKENIVITDLRGRQIDIRPRIYALEWQNGDLIFTVGCGANNLRPDLFCAYLFKLYGENATEIVKLASFGKGVF